MLTNHTPSFVQEPVNIKHDQKIAQLVVELIPEISEFVEVDPSELEKITSERQDAGFGSTGLD